MTFFDDLHVGDIMMTGRQTFTAELIKSFARRGGAGHRSGVRLS